MEELGDPPSPAGYRPPSESRSSLTAPAATEKNQGGTSVIVASAVVLIISALAFGLIGTGDIGHFVLLVFYGAVSLSLGAFLVRPTVPESSHGAVTETPADAASALDGSPAVDVGGVLRVSALNGHGAVGYNTAMMSSSTSASPLHWVGETVEGSLSWLVGNRQRSISAGGALQGSERGHGGSGSAASSPGAGGDRIRAVTTGSRSGALPAPQVSRVWPNISNGRQAAPEAAVAEDPIGGDDGDESVDTDIEGEEVEGSHGGRVENGYAGGGRMCNQSETGSLSSGANGLHEEGDVSWHQEAAGELNWEVDGRRQMLRRSITSPGIPTEDNQMVQNLLEMISDKPVNHAGQWIPVRVRRGIHIWTSTMEGSPYCRIRGRMRCEATPAQLLSLLIDDERIGEYDRMFDRYELVERPNDQTSVRWTCYRAIWPTRPRDFVIRSTWEEFADGTIVIATRSVEHEDYPETPTFVRGTMVTCGYVLCPLGESRRRRRSSKQAAPLANAVVDTKGALSSDGAAALRSPELRPSSEVTMYAHTDLGGYLPASVINKLCKKPAYRVLRKIQDMIETGTLVKRGDTGDGNAGGRVPGDGGSRTNMSRHDSEDLLGSLVAEGMPDLEAASNLEGGHESQGQQGGARRGSVGDGSGASRRNSMEPGPSTPSPLLPALSREVAIREAQRIMRTINRMASDESLGWSQLGVASHSDMALYKCPVLGTKKVRLGASTCVTGESSELVGILLENAAILGPDYILDRQELLETFNSGVNAGEGYSNALAGGEEGEPQHDTAIYWFSCTHKRQRICRDFVILRCFRPLPGCGGVIAYSSIDHPGLPPCPDYVRGRLDTSGFVILPSPRQDDEDGAQHRSRESRRKKRPNWGAGGGRNGHAQGGDSIENSDVGEDESGRGISSSGSNRGGNRRRRVRRVGREAAVSEVTFFTHLTFSAFLPDIQGMEACRHFVGPLHILQELKWVVERTLGSSQDDEVAVEAAAKLLARGGGGGGSDWGKVSGGSDTRPSEGGEEARVVNGDASADEETPSPGSVSEAESAPSGNAVVSNAVRLRVAARREAALRDMLAFASDGEGMDGPQVDWRMIKDDDGMKLWRAAVPGTVWCMIRTRATVPAPPLEVLTYLLDDNCISEYDELFDKIRVIEPVDESSTFKRTCYKPIWPTAPRDFSLLSSWGTLEDGTAYLLNRSVDHPLNPPVKGYVRGVVMLCGFLMVPRAPDSGDGCTITMIVHTDLGGNLPASLINMLSTSSPWRLMLRLRGAFRSTDGRPTRAAAAAAAAASTAAVPAACATQASDGPLNGVMPLQS